MMKNTTQQWGSLAKTLHWLVALLVVGMILVGLTLDVFPYKTKIQMIGIHKSIGATLLALMALRIVWRVVNPTPALPTGTPGWQKLLAGLVHFALYVLVIAMAVSGWLYSNSAGYDVSWFGLFPLPALTGENESLHDLVHEVHELGAWALIVALLLHIGGALKHHFINKNDVLARMVPGMKPPSDRV